MGHRICSFTMLFVVFLRDSPNFCPKCGFKFKILIILNMAPLQKLTLAPRATIRDNTVYNI